MEEEVEMVGYSILQIGVRSYHLHPEFVSGNKQSFLEF